MASSEVELPVARLEWGPRGVRDAAKRGDIVVLVDVLRFSSAAAAAASAGAELIPVSGGEESDWAAQYGAVVADHSSVTPEGAFSLSPGSFAHAEPGARIVMSSANGATCARVSDGASAVFAAGLVNRRAVSEAVNREIAVTGAGVTVVACGERWPEPSEEGELRFAAEDYLGAGAALSGLTLALTPEAEVCRAAFESVRKNIRGLIWNCPSGIELRERGLEEDVHWCSAIDTLNVAPRSIENAFRNDLSLT